jgi:WhiB family transcriptional regulator, redox-sensing transcriptional regulator
VIPIYRPDWHQLANCRGVDPDLFFPERGASAREAKAVCRACDVQAECLLDALNRGEKHGIWGGLSELDRRKIRSAKHNERAA